MQQLQNASDWNPSPAAVARELLDAVPRATFIIRETAYRHRTKSVSFPQLRVLAIVSKVPCADLSSIARQLALSLSATSRLAEHLVAKKLLQRKTPRDNRRKISLSLTAAGKRTLAHTTRGVEKELAACLENISPESRRTLFSAMTLLRDMCCAACAAHD
jgi:DNA-binding MarR family transcriptional regulator